MQLFAANCTPQDFELNYRVPESNRTLKSTIPSGQNRPVGSGDFTSFQVQGIIEQGKGYGMVDVNELDRVPDGKMISILFSKDKAVPPSMIRDVMDRNRRDLTAEGLRRRRDLAVAAARVINQQDPNAADRASVEFNEETPGTVSMESGGKLQEGYAGPESRVAKEAPISRDIATGSPKGFKKGRR